MSKFHEALRSVKKAPKKNAKEKKLEKREKRAMKDALFSIKELFKKKEA